MNLGALFDGLDYRLACGTQDKDIESLIYHSDKAAYGCAFFAIKGAEHDGREYIKDALEKGASVIAAENCDEDLKKLVESFEACLVTVPDGREALALASCNFYGHPAKKLFTVGITGTKGKTTTAFMVKELLEKAGVKTGIIGTVVSGYEGNYSESAGTTPQSLEIQKMLADMVSAGCGAVVMEVSSQGLMQKRVWGIEFDAAVFTNISPDHIGGSEHKNFEEYLYWKSQLFKQAKVAIINKDDSFWKYMAEEATKAEVRSILTFGTEGRACGPVSYPARNAALYAEEGKLWTEFFMDHVKVRMPMAGKFNVSNALGAMAAAGCLGIGAETAAAALENITVRGRTELVPCGKDFAVMVDYAHNGVALESLLRTLREYEPGNLIVVFGCGGDRDRSRRPEMGRAAARFADFSVVTSDNPRTEEPLKIIEDITKEMTAVGCSFEVEPDRKQAIWRALELAEEGDIVVICGKGHETYQIIGNEKRHFDDREVILEWASLAED